MLKTAPVPAGAFLKGDTVRVRQSLDGTWDFQYIDGYSEAPPDAPWGQAEVPLVWQAQFEHLRNATGTGWYRRTLHIPADWRGSAVTLHIGAAYHITTVWLNGAQIAQHADGYLPLDVDVAPYLRTDGPNELVVRVVSPSDDETEYPAPVFSQLPHGKQSWYGHLGGIWQSVWIERRSPVHIADVQVHPNLHTGEIRCEVTLNHDTADYRVVCTVFEANASEVVVPVEGAIATVTATVPNPLAWSPDAPNLYTVVLELRDADDQPIDEVEKTTGFRTIEARDGMLYLNGEPFYLRGALDQDYYPGTITTPPSSEYLEDQMHKARAMGLNCLRYHIKLADPRYYEAADRVGVFLWVDYPNWAYLTDWTRAHVKQSLLAMLRRDRHHPSIGIWTIINEDWGTDLVGDAEHRAWLRGMYGWLKAADPTRLVVDNSPNDPNFHIETDINDFHFYAAMPDNIAGWDHFVAHFASGTYRTYSPHGDALQHGDEPRIVSEFGNWGLPDVDTLLEDGREPWWFENGSDWGEGTVYPHGIKRRFEMWHLHRAFGSWESFVAASQGAQFRALSHEIDQMRLEPRVAGYVITEFTDLHWEANGLLDFQRRPKAYGEVLPQINGQTTLIPQVDHTSYWAGELASVYVSVSHLDRLPLRDVRLALHADSTEIAALTIPEIGFHRPSGHLFEVRLPADVATTRDVHYTFRLSDASGHLIAERGLDLPVFSNVVPTHTLWAPTEGLRDHLAARGYNMSSSPQTSDLIVADRLTPAMTQLVREGCHALLLAEDADAIPSESSDPLVIDPYFPAARIVARRYTSWEGNWASTMGWLALPGFGETAQVLDARFKHMMPEYVITGFKPVDFGAHVYAGLIAGWIHRPVALVARRRYGKGQLLITTFRLLSDAHDPVAAVLLDALVERAMR